jgi:hypothetical protein
MNILNLCIDQLRIRILKWLASTLSEKHKQELLNYEFCGIRAVHQIMGLGDPTLLDIIITDFGGNLNTKAAHGIMV